MILKYFMVPKLHNHTHVIKLVSYINLLNSLTNTQYKFFLHPLFFHYKKTFYNNFFYITGSPVLKYQFNPNEIFEIKRKKRPNKSQEQR